MKSDILFLSKSEYNVHNKYLPTEFSISIYEKKGIASDSS